MAKSKKREPTTVVELLEDINEAIAEIKREQGSGYEGCIFRGEPSDEFEKITSSLYRGLDERQFIPAEPIKTGQLDQFTTELKKLLANRYKKVNRQLLKREFAKDIKTAQSKVIGDDMSHGDFRKYTLKNLQGRDIENAKDWTGSTKGNVEILAEIQHYGGETNLIDFSENHLVATFFACNGDSYSGDDGRLIILPKQGIKTISRDELIPDDERFIVRPLPGNRRAFIQHSVMLYEPDGYLEYEDKRLKVIKVSRNLKRDVLDYLNELCDISFKSIFPDMQGFIEYQKIGRMLETYTVRVLALIYEQQHNEALEYSNKVMLFNKSATSYTTRAAVYVRLKEYEKALLDCNESIKLDSKAVDTYIIRAGVYFTRGHYEKALQDCNRGLELTASEEKKSMLFLMRAEVYQAMKELDKAQTDREEALELAPGISQKLRDPLQFLD